MDKFVDKRLDGRYLIKSLIGNGGMANVYKAIDLKENRIVAVKILKEECMGNEDLVRRFKNESKVIAVLNHPNIVKVFDVSVSAKLQFIVMEYIDGITLKDYMEYRKEPLTYKETIHFISQVLLALQHAHQKGIVHRDIKPQNIMLLSDGNIKVMDFGIARFSRSENHTITDKAIGSVHYISPEQAKGDVTDSKADIYSVGVMMYEMLCGKLPFESDSPVSVAIKQISDTAVPLRKINASVPEGLEAITEKAMAKDPHERYQSAADMLADLEAFKRNPSIKFEYKYLTDNSPTRYINKVVGRQQQKPAAKKPQTMFGQQSAARTNAAETPTTRLEAGMKGGAQVRTQQKRSRNTASKPHKKIALPVLAGITAAVLIGAVITVLLIFKMAPNSIFSKNIDVDLPNLVNRNISEVKADSTIMGSFTLNIVEEYNSDYESGIIFSQTPKAPKTVKEHSTITVKVSLGVEVVTVPNVIGWAEADAIASLKEVGLSPLVKPAAETDEANIGKVESISDMNGNAIAGSQISSGTTVYVYVVKAEKDVTTMVPDCAGMTLEDAKKVLVAKNLSLGTATEVDNEAAAGTIIETTPVAGKEVPKGTSVDVKVSLGHTHNFVESDVITQATCITPGKRWYRCTAGDASEEREYLDPNNHEGQRDIDPATGYFIWRCCGVSGIDPSLIQAPPAQ
ncbi:MAG: Stk1 family PASTA domain-containing Ser/Thr kinase [Clostridia bacterium]|nr:Stk1 family PASTA domain-containing Ser/Thr kinase [Clostridia bacterium]